MAKLEREEREILSAFERGELQSILEKETEIKKHREYAAATFKADQRINIRLSTKDLTALQKRALSAGVSYQTVIASILHKYVDGQFQERTPERLTRAVRGTAARWRFRRNVSRHGWATAGDRERSC